MKKTNVLMFSESPDIPVVEIDGKRRYVYCHDETKFIQILSVYELVGLYKHIFYIIKEYADRYRYDVLNIKTIINGYPALFTYIVETKTLLCNDHLVNIELEYLPDFNDIREENVLKIYNQTLMIDMFFLIIRSIDMPKELFKILTSQINILRILDNLIESDTSNGNFNIGIGKYDIIDVDISWTNEQTINLYINYRTEDEPLIQTKHIALNKKYSYRSTQVSKDKYKLKFIDAISIVDAIFDLLIKNLITNKNKYIRNSIELHIKTERDYY